MDNSAAIGFERRSLFMRGTLRQVEIAKFGYGHRSSVRKFAFCGILA